MLRFALFTVGFLSLATLAQAAGKKDYTILKVDEDEIPYSRVVTIWNGLFPEEGAPDFDHFDDKVKQNVLRGVVSEHLIHREAMASGIENSVKVKEAIEKLKEKIITQAFLEEKADLQVTDNKVRALYDEQVGLMKDKEEIRARHILVETEDEAKEVLEELEDDEDKFAAIAKKKSLDKASAIRGGDLGYFTDDKMVDAFSKVAFELEEGALSVPVETEFGWHIIQVQDKRKVNIPPFEEVEQQIRDQLRGEAIRAYVNDLVDTAHVTYYNADGKEVELTRTPDKSAKPKAKAKPSDKSADAETDEEKEEE